MVGFLEHPRVAGLDSVDAPLAAVEPSAQTPLDTVCGPLCRRQMVDYCLEDHHGEGEDVGDGAHRDEGDPLEAAESPRSPVWRDVHVHYRFRVRKIPVIASAFLGQLVDVALPDGIQNVLGCIVARQEEISTSGDPPKN